MKSNSYLLLLCILFLTACSSPNSQQQAQQFINEEIGWTIEIPTGFNSLNPHELAQQDEKGKQAVESGTGQKVVAGKLVHLLNFQKDQLNSLNATIQLFDQRKENYQTANQATKKAIFDAYAAQKIKIDTSSFTNSYAGESFHGFLIKIYAPNGEVLMHQLMLSQLRRGYDFAININYNNENDATLIMDALKNSKFSK
ncbi:MAG: hypothetical protein REI78_06490 [Pedobacter sp.]|nr:hypothetical protein [Pedobacter sp.]MDQ8052653.1 hypothetical protein [Pedobacter sp.]